MRRRSRASRRDRAMTSMKTCAVVVLLFALAACKVGPNYQRPPLDVPGDYRGLAPEAQPSKTAAPSPLETVPPAAKPSNATPPQPPPAVPPAQAQPSEPTPSPSPATTGPQQPAPGQVAGQPGQTFGDMSWTAVFQDEALQGLIKEALANNYNLRVAATRVLQAGANLGIVRANQLPSVDGFGSIAYQRNLQLPGAPTFGTLGLDFNYLVDFWGQYRRATESARATLLSTEFGRAVVQISLINSVAANYYLLLQYDDQLEYSRKTVEADQEILKLNNIKFHGGEAAVTDVYQAQVILQQAESSVITYQQLAEQSENNLSILLGRNPGPIKRGLSLTDQLELPEIPAGLPSDLLRRRPDVRQAEQNLVAANANVGVAKALFFPQFAITGQFGAQSTALNSFLSGPGTFWAIAGSGTQPIFEGGRIRSNYRLAWAQRDQAELQYKQTLQSAFNDVSNSLIGYQQARKFRMKIEEQTHTYADLVRLSNVRYQGGYTAFLEVQYNEQQYFQSALLLSQAWYLELQYYAALYQSLGGGWQP
ncbi:MAG TPA: efflux transporter outer membrane subunit [Terriglobales bacterium]|nr:efflux transporter outer membrane subunit [Terriglobales bacterium]